MKKSHYDLKDIINIGSINKLLKYLNQFNMNDDEWT